MKNIIIEKKSKKITGTYHGQCFEIELTSKNDNLGTLADEEVMEVLEYFENEKKNEQSMLNVEIGTNIQVSIEEGHESIEYTLKVTSIDEEFVDDDGNYCCIAYGNGVSEEDESLAEEFTHRIEPSNFVKVLN